MVALPHNARLLTMKAKHLVSNPTRLQTILLLSLQDHDTTQQILDPFHL